MNILHFCSYFIGSKVYANFFQSLPASLNQLVFVPIRKKEHRNTNKIEKQNINFIYVNCLSIATRLFLSFKISIVLLLSLKLIKERDKISIVHAHTLYSDGLAAYLYSYIFKKKLIITVRNTDVNLGFKYYPHYKWLVKLALTYAEKIIFVSPSHRKKFVELFSEKYEDKTYILPNGIDDIFIKNRVNKKNNYSAYSALYIGTINRNKNIYNAIIAFAEVNKKENWRFDIVGGSYSDFLKIYPKLTKDLEKNVFFHEKTNVKSHLIEFYDQASIFIMPSYTETFGLVYIEAISRCLPVVYTQNQGIDGFFPNGIIGEKCQPSNLSSIQLAISQTQKKYPTGLLFKDDNIAVNFSWESIANYFMNNIYS